MLVSVLTLTKNNYLTYGAFVLIRMNVFIMIPYVEFEIAEH